VVPGGQPGGKARLGSRQVDSSHTDLGESKLLAPASQFAEQLRAIQRSMVLSTHPQILETRIFHWPDEAACVAFARQLAASPTLRPDTFIALAGPLGAGKTTFARHLLRALGVQGRIKSPSFAVLEPYEINRLTISHFDFYRFENAHEWSDAGFRDVFAAPGLKLAEWPENAAGVLPTPDWQMELEMLDGDQRRVTVHAHTDHGRRLLAGMA
jgi:tRNA threonylcarbamoyladenosine biosynthesis protein TsaE